MKRLALVCTVVLLSSFVAISAAAQSAASATIIGTVADPQGAVVPGAKVTATNVDTGVPRSVNTTSTGNYVLPNLPPGTYNIKVEAKGFAEANSKNLKLNVGDQQTLNFNVAIAGSSQTIEVTAEAPLIETTKTDVSTSVTDVEMQKLPTFAATTGGVNDYASLALTAPGVKQDTSTLTTDFIAPGAINNRANLYNVDGANITDQLVSGRDGLGASVDEIQEFQVLTNNYNAEYGQAGGLIINAVTKSGTNQFHGDAHMYFRGRNLQASSPIYNIGFIDPATGLVADPRCPNNGISGDISGCPRAPFHRKEGGFTIGGPFVKDKLFFFGSYELSRQAVPLTLTPSGGNITLQEPVNNLLWSAKLDYKLSPKHSISARFNVDRILQDNLIVQTSNNITPDALTSNVAHVSTINAGIVSSLTPTIVNEARFAFVRTLTSTPDKTTTPGAIHTNTGTITGANFCCPQGGLNKRYQYIDNLTWTHGNHSFKTGGTVSYYPWFSLFPQFHFGQYRVNVADTAATSFTFGFGPGQVVSKDNIYGFYFQDTWKMFRNFTLNYGVRYDLEAGAFKGGKIHGPNGTCFQGNGLIPACSSDYNNWQPRLGFTYQPWKATLFKASFAEVTMLAFNNVVLDSLNFDGTTLNTITTTNPAVLAAYPNAPDPALLASLVPPGSDFFGRVRPISPNLKNPEIHMVNASIQHEFGKNLVGEIQYIGQMGSGLFGERDVNAPVIAADPAHPGFFYFQNQAPVDPALGITARPDNRFTAIRTNENSRTSQYHGMLVSVTKKMSNHFSLNGSYTWSHAITSGEDFFGLSEPGDPTNIKAERGPAFNDARHAVNLSGVFETGRLSDTHIVRLFTNDISFGVVEQLQSGRPYPFSTGTGGFANAIFFGTGSETQQRPNVLPDGTISTAGIASADGTNALILNGPFANTFAAPGDASAFGAVAADDPSAVVDFKQLNGNMTRDAGRGNAFYRTDASIKKTIRIPGAERVRVELQADVLNLFNHANYLGFNAFNVLSVLPLGSATCTNCLRPNGTYAGNAGQILHLSDITHGRISSNLLDPAFGGKDLLPGQGLGDPSTVDQSRLFQLSFHVRF
ncbi:MAG TPA: TonB-dependent receptor [Candidatus Angelobacter sp.]|nr:TonB-dependent receptor [Candidatus Angelobacter sp.]